MLSFLNVRGFALIDELSLDFFPGLNVLTGETGAGKSIVIGAIGLILGERASSEHIRSGSDEALIEAVFHPPHGLEELEEKLQALGLPETGDEVVVTREITRSGRNTCRINGRMVPLGALKELGSVLVDLHGQHTHQSLLKPGYHLFLLDEFGGEELLAARKSLRDLYDHWTEITKELKALGSSEEERARKLELFRYQQEEIERAELKPEEEKQLEQKLLFLDNQGKILNALHRAHAELYGGEVQQASVLDVVGRIKEELSSLQEVDPNLSSFVQILQEVSAGLSELGHDLFSYLDSFEVSVGEREDIEKRLELYRRLKAKYGPSVEEVLAYGEQCAEEMEHLQKSEERARLLEEKQRLLLQDIQQAAGILTEKRDKASRQLEGLVQGTLGELGMEKAEFQVFFRQLDFPGRKGQEEVEFMFSANPGEPPRPLSRIASGGEMARVMLALKCILAEQDRIPTLIFDEIDSGIGGRVIQRVAEKMVELGRKHQVICVTHSPHIASSAHHQYQLYKEEAAGRMITRVRQLEGEKRIEEIARLLDGDPGGISRRHARELLQKAEEFREE